MQWTQELTKSVIAQYRKFIYLLFLIKSASPPKMVDEVWHAHMALTENYKAFCEAIYGKDGFIHHSSTSSKSVASSNHRHYSRVIKKYKQQYGHWPQTSIWPHELDKSSVQLNKKQVITNTNGANNANLMRMDMIIRQENVLAQELLINEDINQCAGNTLSRAYQSLPAAQK